MNGVGEDLPGGEKLRQEQHFRCAPLAQISIGQPPLQLQMWWCGRGLSLVWAWCPFADFALRPAVKMSFSFFRRALSCGQAQALCPRAQEGEPVTAGHCQGQLGHLLSFGFHVQHKTKADANSKCAQGPGTSLFNPSCQHLFPS